jgi:hypothetical protein
MQNWRVDGRRLNVALKEGIREGKKVQAGKEKG